MTAFFDIFQTAVDTQQRNPGLKPLINQRLDDCPFFLDQGNLVINGTDLDTGLTCFGLTFLNAAAQAFDFLFDHLCFTRQRFLAAEEDKPFLSDNIRCHRHQFSRKGDCRGTVGFRHQTMDGCLCLQALDFIIVKIGADIVIFHLEQDITFFDPVAEIGIDQQHRARQPGLDHLDIVAGHNFTLGTDNFIDLSDTGPCDCGDKKAGDQ